jgi:murein DD-endopeptidase MepM/ murein hydrolase activator NlpD
MKNEPGATATQGASRRSFLGLAGLLAAGFTMADLALFPAPQAKAAVSWFHPFQTRGNITSGYGMRVNPVTGVYTLHDGIDYNPPEAGTPVQSCASGVVTEVPTREATGGYGWYVVVAHNDGYETLYGHLQAGSIRVSVGQKIGASAVVGRLGNSGSSTAAHLHLRLHRSGNPLDPRDLLHTATLATANEQTTPIERKEVQVIQNTERGIAIIGSNPAGGAANFRQLRDNEQAFAATAAWGAATVLTVREFDLVRALATNTGIA